MDIAQRRQYKAVCECGWRSDEWMTAQLARVAAAGHEARTEHPVAVAHFSEIASLPQS